MAVESLVVVHERFTFEHPVSLNMKEKMLSWTGNDFRITEEKTKCTWFKVKGRALNMISDKRVLVDVDENVLATLKDGTMSFRHKLCVIGPAFRFQVVGKPKVLRNEAKAVVMDLHTRERHALYMYGHWSDCSMQLYLGRRSKRGRLLAQAGRRFALDEFMFGTQEYVLKIEPWVDVALCVLMCITYDELNNDIAE